MKLKKDLPRGLLRLEVDVASVQPQLEFTSLRKPDNKMPYSPVVSEVFRVC